MLNNMKTQVGEDEFTALVRPSLRMSPGPPRLWEVPGQLGVMV